MTQTDVIFARKVRLDRRARQLVMRGWCWVFGHAWSDPFIDEGLISETCVNRCGGLRLTRLPVEEPPEWPSDHVKAMHDLAYTLGEVRACDLALARPGLSDGDQRDAYALRRQMLAAAIGQAHRCGFDWGFRIDARKDADWPVLYIELPTGQVSWHMPRHAQPWDGHLTELKLVRIESFQARLAAGAYDDLAASMF